MFRETRSQEARTPALEELGSRTEGQPGYWNCIYDFGSASECTELQRCMAQAWRKAILLRKVSQGCRSDGWQRRPALTYFQPDLLLELGRPKLRLYFFFLPRAAGCV